MERKVLWLASTAAVLISGDALSQDTTTRNLTVSGGYERVINSPAPFDPVPGSPIPYGVYTAGNPVIRYCPADRTSCPPTNEQIHAQLLMAGKALSGTVSEHAFYQQYFVDTGGQNPNTVGKEGFDTSTVVRPTPGIGTNVLNAPKVWSMNGNLILLPGTRSNFAVGLEQDLTNDSGFNCRDGVTGDCHVILALAQGGQRSTSGITVGGDGGVLYGIDIGERGGGRPQPFASEAAIRIRDSAPNGILFSEPLVTNGVAAARAHATIEDRSKAPAAFHARGDYSGPVFLSSTNGSIAFESTGTKTGADFFANGTRSPRGLLITGHHQLGAILEHSVSDATGSTPYSLQTQGVKTSATVSLEDQAPVGLRIAGNHGVGISLENDRNSAVAISMNQGQQVCWSSVNCVTWTAGDGYKFSSRSANGVQQNVARIDSAGDLWIRGRVREYVPTGGGL